eukprot:2797811-Amphidinium_carterae.1
MEDVEDAIAVRLEGTRGRDETPREIPRITGFATAVFSMATPRGQVSPRSLGGLDVSWLADALVEAQRENAHVRKEVIEAESSRQNLQAEFQQNLLWAQQQGSA